MTTLYIFLICLGFIVAGVGIAEMRRLSVIGGALLGAFGVFGLLALKCSDLY